MRDRMKKASTCLLLVVALSLVPAVVSCQPATPPQTEGIEPASELQVDMLGALHTLSLDSEGKLIAGAELASPDGAITLSIAKGTRLLDKDGRTLTLLWLKIDSEPIFPSEEAYIIGEVYHLGPPDAIFDPPLTLTLSYDPSELPEGVREDNVYIAPYDEAMGWGKYSYKRVDTERHQVTTQIERMTRYTVLAPITPASSEPAPKSPSAPDLTSIPLRQALSSGKPTLSEFGSNTCIPCKQMKPILEELAGEYKDKLNVVIVEVYAQMELTSQYGIMAIPTQIVFDSKGKEITRHVGFWAKKDIIAQLKKMRIE